MATIYGTNNDFQVPSLDLRFADRKNLVDTISGRNLITFSRDSIGTYVDENGVLTSASTNVARFDHNLSTLQSLGLLVEESRTNYAPLNRDFLYPAPAYFSNFGFGGLVMSAGTNYTLFNRSGLDQYSKIWNVTFYVYKTADNDVLSFQLFATVYAGTSTATTTVDGITLSTSGEGNTTVSITPLGNNLYKCNATAKNASAGGTPSVTLRALGTFTGTEICLVSHIQAEQGSFATSYIPNPRTFTSRSTTATYYDANGVIQTAGIDVARSNAYFPDSNGVMQPAGLLLEGARTNLTTWSQDITNTGWDLFLNAGRLANQETAPDGTLTADHFISTQASDFIRREAPTTNGVTYAISFFAKSVSGDTSLITDLGDGTTAVFTLTSTWRRYSYVAVATALTYVDFRLNGAGTCALWGMQLEAGSYPTSYIPTTSSTVTRAADVSTSSTVTRSADVAQMTGSNFSSWYTQGSGTVLAEYRTPASGTRGVIGFNDNTANERLAVYTSGTDPKFIVVDGGVTQADLDGGTVSSTSLGRSAVAFSANNFAISHNGGAVVTDTSGTVATPDRVFIGADQAGNYQNGQIKRVSYYPTRLSNSILQKLTK